MSQGIEPIVMPKWGLAMQEGMLAAWLVEEGAAIAKGQEIAEIETSKIANVFESPVDGVLRRRVAQEGETLPVGALLAVAASAEVADGAIDAFVAEFQASFVPAEGTDGGPEPQTVEAGGRRLRYLELGSGAAVPLILVHGFGGDLGNWLFNQEELAADRRVIALDLPGHGGSGKAVERGDLAELATALTAFMDALGIERAHLAGHSLGGAVVLTLALERPERAASLTLVAPAGLGPEIAIEYIEGFLQESRARKLRPVLEMLVADPALVTAEMVEDVLKAKRLDGALAALGRIAAASFADGRQRQLLRDRLAELEVPTQVIWGEADRILPAAHAEGLPAAIAVHRLPATGHLAHMERAAEVNARIREIARTR